MPLLQVTHLETLHYKYYGSVKGNASEPLASLLRLWQRHVQIFKTITTWFLQFLVRRVLMWGCNARQVLHVAWDHTRLYWAWTWNSWTLNVWSLLWSSLLSQRHWWFNILVITWANSPYFRQRNTMFTRVFFFHLYILCINDHVQNVKVIWFVVWRIKKFISFTKESWVSFLSLYFPVHM